MLLLGFGAALRRSELVALTLGDVTTVPGRGLRVLVRRSKTDQQGQGQEIAVCANPAEPGFCPSPRWKPGCAHRRAAPDLDWTARSARATRARCSAPSPRPAGSPGKSSPTRRSSAWSSRPRATPASTRRAIPAHSLRAGLATAAGDAGAGLAELMRQTRHKSTEVALGYLRPADLWRNNVTEQVFRQRRGRTA